MLMESQWIGKKYAEDIALESSSGFLHLGKQ